MERSSSPKVVEEWMLQISSLPSLVEGEVEVANREYQILSVLTCLVAPERPEISFILSLAPSKNCTTVQPSK
jgi:hypothetical protein